MGAVRQIVFGYWFKTRIGETYARPSNNSPTLRDIPLASARNRIKSGGAILTHWRAFVVCNKTSVRWEFPYINLENQMFRSTRDDTLIKTVEDRYGINLHARGNTKLGNLLEHRGFDSLTQLLKAHRGDLNYHASKRRVYLSFHVEDLPQVNGFRLMARAPNLEIDFHDGSLREVINSARGSYIKQQIRSIIQKTSVLVCLIGNGTAWRDWVDWELDTAFHLGKGICGIRLKDSRGRAPQLLRDIDAPIAHWGDVQDLIRVIECAAARRC
jgi:hypothetical protein